MNDVCRQYLDFIADFRGWPKSVWLKDDAISIYIRKGRHLIDNHLIDTIDIANVSNQGYDEDTSRGRYHQGHFRRFMEFVERYNPFGVIYVESVISKRMEEILKKNGYVPSTHEHCYHKFVGTYRIGSTNPIQDLVKSNG